jgi:hypothetical protein
MAINPTIAVQQYINTSYDIIKSVYNNLDVISAVGAYFLNQSSAHRTVDNSIIGTTLLQSDDELVLPVDQNTVYEITGWLEFSCASATPDLKVNFTEPSGATWKAHFYTDTVGNGGAVSDIHYSSGSTGWVVNMTGSNNAYVEVRLSLQVGANAGNLVFQFAQNVQDATPLILKANSWIKAIKVS